jgi:hypothetical protein
LRSFQWQGKARPVEVFTAGGYDEKARQQWPVARQNGGDFTLTHTTGSHCQTPWVITDGMRDQGLERHRVHTTDVA